MKNGDFAISLRVKSSVFPAHAGFIPRRYNHGTGQKGLPRACGVHPLKRTSTRKRKPSSPRMRGSSSVCRSSTPLCPVFPAHAGFTLPNVTFVSLGFCLPRASGVHPTDTYVTPERSASSPRMRGSSRLHSAQKPEWVVFPAHAGFIPDRYGNDHPCSCLPRACGVHPPILPISSATEESSVNLQDYISFCMIIFHLCLEFCSIIFHYDPWSL